jgi:hypothetical protein
MMRDLALTATGLTLAQFALGKETDNTQDKNKGVEPLLPFYLPPLKPLKPGQAESIYVHG